MKVMLNTNTTYNRYQNNSQTTNPAFKGLYSDLTVGLAKGFAKIAKSPKTHNFIDKIAEKDVISILAATTGIVISGFYIYNTAKSKKIEKEQKKPLMINMALVTAMSTVLGLFIDEAAKAKVNQFINFFEKRNAGKLSEDAMNFCQRGIPKAATLLIFTTIYRYLAPVVATPLANKISNSLNNNKPKTKA